MKGNGTLSKLKPVTSEEAHKEAQVLEPKTVDFEKVLLTLEGNPLVGGDYDKSVMKSIALRALSNASQGSNISLPQKLSRYDLSLKIFNANEPIGLEDGELKELISSVHEFYSSPAIVGQFFRLIYPLGS